MPFVLITIGAVMFATAINGTYKQLGAQLYSDVFTSKPPFIFWALALIVVGFIGYIPGAKKPADWFMFLIIIGMVLANGGFFTKLEQAIQAGPSATGSSGTTATTATTAVNPFSGLFGNVLLQQQASLGAEPLTTPAPIAGGTPLGQGGIGAA